MSGLNSDSLICCLDSGFTLTLIQRVNMDIPGKKPSSINKAGGSLTDEDQDVGKTKRIQTKKIPASEGIAAFGMDIKRRKIDVKDLPDNSKNQDLHITQKKLTEKGVMFVGEDSQKTGLKIANLIFSSMNDIDNPLYTCPSGAESPSATVEAQRIKSRLSLDAYDELDYFIELHLKNKKLDLKTSVTDEELDNIHKKYGVVILNGLHPEKHSVLILGCGHDLGDHHSGHSGHDTLDIIASLKPDVLLQWGDKRATEFLRTLNKKYDEIRDEGPLCNFMRFSDEYFLAVRACLAPKGKLRLPRNSVEESKIPLDFVKEDDLVRQTFGARQSFTTYTYHPPTVSGLLSPLIINQLIKQRGR